MGKFSKTNRLAITINNHDVSSMSLHESTDGWYARLSIWAEDGGDNNYESLELEMDKKTLIMLKRQTDRITEEFLKELEE